MKQSILFLFCLCILAGCSKPRHEALIQSQTTNAAAETHKSPKEPITINTLFPDELPSYVGKVEQHHGYTPKINGYSPFRRYFPRRWY